ncbi:hypothetical protein PENTCL1PPCAC_18731 [Pristionchus entomophagus]|uniref:Secreted protein n=1 Tax=Pristionchus entomophagus TaxID=358040 RepID=A0AAV5TQB1_9BILA|nr:hypothetical protein PENTCL1PPCAC_18731 [Pristionchus entomophagus]
MPSITKTLHLSIIAISIGIISESVRSETLIHLLLRSSTDLVARRDGNRLHVGCHNNEEENEEQNL